MSPVSNGTAPNHGLEGSVPWDSDNDTGSLCARPAYSVTPSGRPSCATWETFSPGLPITVNVSAFRPSSRMATPVSSDP